MPNHLWDSPSRSLACGGIQKGDSMQAQESAQRDEGSEGSWVHAYLHRKEGDQGNAGYWYGPGWEARLPGIAGCGMAQYRE